MIYTTDFGDIRNWTPRANVRMTKSGQPDRRYAGADVVLRQIEAESAFMANVMRTIEHSELVEMMGA